MVRRDYTSHSFYEVFISCELLAGMDVFHYFVDEGFERVHLVFFDCVGVVRRIPVLIDG